MQTMRLFVVLLVVVCAAALAHAGAWGLPEESLLLLFVRVLERPFAWVWCCVVWWKGKAKVGWREAVRLGV